jgi:hypothetical protein
VAVSADNLTLLDLLENPLPGSRGGHGADIVGLQVWIEMIEFQNAPVRMTTVSAALVAQELPHLHPVRVALNLGPSHPNRNPIVLCPVVILPLVNRVARLAVGAEAIWSA